MSRCGTLRTWAQELGYEEAAEILQSTLEEEQATDMALTAVCYVCGGSKSRRLISRQAPMGEVEHIRQYRESGSPAFRGKCERYVAIEFQRNQTDIRSSAIISARAAHFAAAILRDRAPSQS